MLVVDDEELYRRALERILSRVGHEVVCAKDATEALTAVTSTRFDLVLSDLKMPGIDGIELLRQIADLEADLPCILITGHGSVEASVEALSAGAFWYLEKPFDQANLDVVRGLVQQAIEYGRLKSENRALHGQLRARYKFENIIGKSAALRSVLDTVDKVADTDSTVLVTGASGTGKELIARALHFNSSRAARPLITVNCGAIPEELLESELFGHVKGAFTNAIATREGRFAAAHGGTLFLDEIGDMSATLQVKLLRVLQERTFEPVGSSKTQHVDVRVIAATHQDLEELISERRFREDLYYRLNVLPIRVPSLTERRDDIPLLVHHFIDVVNQEQEMQIDGVTDAAMEHLIAYDWPGNIRQLENWIERMAILQRT
ncbi:MAG: sigma-54 dependent transcriptional regulator, partial [Myxococcota bacterium]|nr:sigma-54 dependent transcriptional regulator [Myxococcota bacterium]